MRSGERPDLLHTHSKLGIFLEEAIGPAWIAAGRTAEKSGT